MIFGPNILNAYSFIVEFFSRCKFQEYFKYMQAYSYIEMGLLSF